MPKQPSTRKGKVNARVRAKDRMGKKQPGALVRQDLQTRMRGLMDMGVTKKQMAEIARQVGGRLMRVEMVMADEAPPSQTLELPPRSTKKGASKLDTKLAREICKQLERGAQLSLVCSWVGVTPAILTTWLKQPGEPYETFQAAVRKSLAFAEMKMLNLIAIGSYNDPQVALKWMQMRYPAKYANPDLPAGAKLTFDLGAFLSDAWQARAKEFEARKAKLLAASEGKVIEGEITPVTEDSKV